LEEWTYILIPRANMPFVFFFQHAPDFIEGQKMQRTPTLTYLAILTPWFLKKNTFTCWVWPNWGV
jgi:hypothetical protein